ncbi:MAG: MFS transporter [bacterium]|nr:MFS transporter [bacterium]
MMGSIAPPARPEIDDAAFCLLPADGNGLGAGVPAWLARRGVAAFVLKYRLVQQMFAISLSWLGADKGITTIDLLIRGLFFGFGSGGMILLSISMLGDTMAYDRTLTGQDREGLLSSVIAVIEKVAFVGGVAVVGLYLKFADYVPTRNGALVEQPASGVAALYICYAVIPVVLFLMNALCIWFFILGGRTLANAVIASEPAGI